MVIPSDRFAFLASTITLFSLSHPFLFMLDRGNWEGLLLPLCWFYVLLYKNKNKFSWIFLGVAVCIKPQTALLGVLPILQEDYVSPIKAILLSIMILSITLFLIPGPIIASLISLKAGICFWSMHSSIRFNHTLSNIFPLLIRTHYSTPLGFFSFLIGILALLSLWKSRKKLNYTHQALALITMMITLVPISYDYTLIELFPIVALFIADALRSPEEGDRLAPMLLVLCLILSPKEEFIGISPQLPFGIGYIANAVLLLILLCLALCGFGGVSAKTMPLHPRTCDSVK